MANHVTRRASGWTYQRRVPSRLVKHFGSKHVRMPLGRLSAAEARRVARRISVRLDLVWEFAEEEAVADDVEKIIQDMEQAIKNWEKYDEIFVDMIKGQATKLAEAETERAALQLTIRSIATAGEPPHPPALLFSAESARIIEAKRKALSARSTYPNKLRNAARAWILICGDHPVDRYRPAQLQDFADDLARLPRDWAVTERYRKLSYTEVVRIFDAETAKVVAAGKPPPLRFSQRNIAEYLAQVTHLLEHARANDPTRVADFKAAPRTIPKTARKSRERSALPIESVNRWFKAAAREKRADDRFLPLLGALTGARLGELVYARRDDVQDRFGHVCLNLIDDYDDSLSSDTYDAERPIKTPQSRRFVVVHDIIQQTGFLDWVRCLPADSWLWPHLHRGIVKPHAAASKRLLRRMKVVGIHDAYKDVFHSLRHGAKDWHRDEKVDDRTSRLQVGHKFANVGQSYGSKVLREPEFNELASLPLPEGLDVTPYCGLGTKIGQTTSRATKVVAGSRKLSMPSAD